MALPYFLIALGNLIRFFWNLFEPVVPSFDEQSGFNALYYLLAIGVSLVTLFGYYMMNSIRVERSLIAKDDEIEGRNRELAELVRTRSLFLSVIAHDLRGPIGGSARYLRKHLLKPGVRLEDKTAALETLATSLDLTHALLEKLLWWSRGQEEEWKPAKEKVELAPVLEGVRALMEEVIGAKDLRVEFSIHAGAESLVGDRECVELILRNLLSNAVKFSHGGGRIGIEARPEGRGVRITVEDEGIGIDEGMMAGLFRMETKHSRKGTEGEPGSGLGLILCRSLAEKSGGSMEVTSVFGKGTRVSLSLPGPPL
jgi:signal transduction histidine kinase